jgi:uncharacterized protein YqgC (DUF456 family)
MRDEILSTTGLILASLFFLFGLAGTFIPALPGAPLIFLGMLIYGYFDGFVHLNWTFYLLQGLAVIIVFLLDYLAGVWGVKRYGGSKIAVWGSIIGSIIGLIFLGPLGIILGPFLGAIAGELLMKKSAEQALRSGWGTVIGFLGGLMMKLTVEIAMIIWFFMVVL